MSRTVRGSKPGGYEFWSRRPQSGGVGKVSKTICHGQERAIARRELEENIREEFSHVETSTIENEKESREET